MIIRYCPGGGGDDPAARPLCRVQFVFAEASSLGWKVTFCQLMRILSTNGWFTAFPKRKLRSETREPDIYICVTVNKSY